MLFGDYIYQWNEDNKNSLQATTYGGYKSQIIRSIQPYFNARGITLQSITADDIRLYYKILIRKVSASTVRRYHSNIRKCLQEAFEDDKIQSNPADKVKLPKGDTFVGDYYNKDELIKLLEVVKGTKLEFPVFIAVYYGLRRSEIAGLKWSAIDFTYKTLSIVHTVVYCNVDGKAAVVAKDRTKTVKSMRTLPLMPVVEEMLLRMKAEQEQNRQFFKKSYKEQGYIYVLADGTPVNPDYITKAFIKFIKSSSLHSKTKSFLPLYSAKIYIKNFPSAASSCEVQRTVFMFGSALKRSNEGESASPTWIMDSVEKRETSRLLLVLITLEIRNSSVTRK